MAILADATIGVLIHGATNPLARFQCSEMLRYGTRLCGVVGGSAEKLRNQLPEGVPIFPNALRAVAATGATVSLVFNDPYEVRSAVWEAIDARSE